MDNTFKSPTIISFCTGGRMLERGLERAIGNVTVATYVEIEAFCIFNLVAQMEKGLVDASPIWTDAKTFPAHSFHGKIHGIIGGYPCQPFSTAGKRLGEDDPRHLWPYLQSHINSIRPVWCFFENVDDHLSLGFDTVYKDLRALGYRVEAGIYSAREVGAPHERKRLFILAVADSYCKFRRLSKCESRQARPVKRDCVEIDGGSKSLGYTESFIPGRLSVREGTKKPGFEDNGETISDSSCIGSYQVRERRQSKQLNTNGTSRRVEKWPARPGEQQHEWEHPRIVESGVGCTVNGYNFREDLLRMLGNGVVEQTAELAFIDLLKKHNI
ncbi:DNA cytosine methyltransferase [Mucilaginibacter sp. ZB1P21]|uniref:DNA (cytosine-5-)-methyltransferase n=1 Tax=Mucilaginibacter glaciei TaxID=2772109 RepID=A0A926S3I6_9SPHI|nr:DNA cytosine methyltransferase [Mucilaginibacter glaciei]